MALTWPKFIQQGDLAGVRRWLDAGGDIEATEPRQGHTPLLCAVQNGRLEIAKLLVERGADRDSAFVGAVITGHGDIARFLLPLGVDTAELRDAFDLLRWEGADDELCQLVKDRLQDLKRQQKPAASAKKKASKTSAAKAAKAPKSSQEQEREEEEEWGPEALEWLRDRRHALAQRERFRSKQEVVRFVKDLYAAGAVRVLVPTECIEEDTGAYANGLVVLLPDDPAKRERLFALCDPETYAEDADGMPVPEDQDHIYLCWEWE
jgi:hypothetical protein